MEVETDRHLPKRHACNARYLRARKEVIQFTRHASHPLTFQGADHCVGANFFYLELIWNL